MSALQRGSRNCLRNPYQPRGTSSYKSVCLSPSSPIDPSLFHTLSLFFPSFPNHHHLCNEPREPCRQRLRQLISVISTIVRCSMSLKSKRSLSLSLLHCHPPNPTHFARSSSRFVRFTTGCILSHRFPIMRNCL